MYKIIIIGAGSIGTTKDPMYDSPITKEILTHAHSVYNSTDCELIGIVDKDFDKAYEAALKWHTKPYEHISHIKDQADIIIVATPTETHKKVLLECLEYNPKIVIAEKPFCMNSQEAEEVIKSYKEKQISISVDYIRNFVDEIKQLSYDLIDDKYGEIYSCILYYVRGTAHEAGHFINFANNSFGEFIEGKVFDKGIPDRDIIDTSKTVKLQYEKCNNVFMIPIDSRVAFNVFNIEIMTEKCKIILSDHGKYIEYYYRIPEPTYGDYNTLSAFSQERYKTGLTTALSNVILEALSIINGCEYKFSCTAYDALKVHKILEKI